jgi:hypothetical protein
MQPLSLLIVFMVLGGTRNGAHMNEDRSPLDVKPATVVAEFLRDMTVVAGRTFPRWNELYLDGLVDIAPNGSELHRQFADTQPLDDLYFATVVALETARVRRYLEPQVASDVLAEIAAQADAAAGRLDRVVSDLVFVIVGRIELELRIESMTMPYDVAIHALLDRIGLPNDSVTRALMSDLAFRHALGEPLARGVPPWWKKFAARLKALTTAQNQAGYVAYKVAPAAVTKPYRTSAVVR